MAHNKPLDLQTLRTELQRAGATWASVDTTIAMLEEDDREVLLGVPLPSEPEIQRIEAQGMAIAQTGPVPPMGTNGASMSGVGASFDARSHNGQSYVTPVRNQGSCGSCVAFGAVATVETTAAFTRGQPQLKLDLSEQHLFFVHGPASGASCSNGWWPEHAFSACRDKGVTFEEYMPYQAGGGGTLNADWPNRLAKLTSFQTLTGNVPAIKQHILTRGAVSACLIVYQDFFSYGGGVYTHVSGGQAGGHCVSLVGFDDAQGCWIGKNSWGSGWGEAGFFRIGYGQCGIETWRVHGADFVNLRFWVDATIKGLFSNESADNAWAYVDKLGWARLAHGTPGVNQSMLTEVTSGRLRNKPVRAFHADGTLTETYVF